MRPGVLFNAKFSRVREAVALRLVEQHATSRSPLNDRDKKFGVVTTNY